VSFAAAVEPRLDGGSCPHMAVVLRSGRELPAVLASFYALGARRGGWWSTTPSRPSVTAIASG
jgi:hypothetical protein